MNTCNEYIKLTLKQCSSTISYPFHLTSFLHYIIYTCMYNVYIICKEKRYCEIEIDMTVVLLIIHGLVKSSITEIQILQ